MSDPDPNPASALDAWAYCPRLGVLPQLHGELADNAFAVEGKRVHQRVDDERAEVPESRDRARPTVRLQLFPQMLGFRVRRPDGERWTGEIDRAALERSGGEAIRHSGTGTIDPRGRRAAIALHATRGARRLRPVAARALPG